MYEDDDDVHTKAGIRVNSQSGTCYHHPPRSSHSAECTAPLAKHKSNRGESNELSQHHQ